ncbi:radical SAM protein [Candidatus Margulisiibacteriota bacterium]
MKYIYGPVSSWRLGKSLGIDLISGEKKCTFDCIYCQLGRGVSCTAKREIFISTEDIVSEFEKLPATNVDYITFSGSGEPTLAVNLGEVITEIKKRTKTRVAVLTNSSLMGDEKVRGDLGKADLVVAKMDAPNEKVFNEINRPVKGIAFHDVLNGIKKFNSEYPGKMALQVMFIPQNKEYASKEVDPAEVQINTPLRPSGARPIPSDELFRIKELFKPLKVHCAYDVQKDEVEPLSEGETRKRRPGFSGQ